jgi:hypothetical protein
MKIGFSLGRCLRDIVNGTVPYEDVYLIVSRTAIYDSSQMDYVVEEYLHRPDYLMGLDEGKCYDIGVKLMTEGKLFQPRVTFGRNPRHVAEDGPCSNHHGRGCPGGAGGAGMEAISACSEDDFAPQVPRRKPPE